MAKKRTRSQTRRKQVVEANNSSDSDDDSSSEVVSHTTSVGSSSSSGTRKKSEYSNQINRLFFKNSVLTRLDLSKIFSYDVYKSLSEENQKKLSKYLIANYDMDRDGIAKKALFSDSAFKNSIDQFDSLLSEGYLNSSKNFKEIVEHNIEKNNENGFIIEGVEQFWIDNAEEIETSWVKDL